MTRNYRMSKLDHFESRTPKLKPLTRAEERERAIRSQLKLLKSEGRIGPKIPLMWRSETGAEVVAFTKSEARGMVKQLLGLKRLPVGFKLERISYTDGDIR